MILSSAGSAPNTRAGTVPADGAGSGVVIVGAGHAGAACAIALRQGGYADPIRVIGMEADLPYERPPLSKEYLSGDKPFDRLLIRPPAFWAERDIAFVPSTRIVGVDPTARRVWSDDGRSFGYRTLVWAAGGDARRLTCEGGGLAGVHAVRTRADVDAIVGELPAVRRVAIVGGGYIGLEAAAVLTKLGRQVVLIEALDRVLARVAGPVLSRFFESEHRSHGVDIRLGVGVDRIIGTDRATGVRLVGGEEIAADMVIVGIGIVPAVEPLLAAGADGGNGVAVDAQCRTSLPDIFAIGDCALQVNRHANGAPIRLESVQNATDQAGVAARTLSGIDATYDAVPWFWSNQYDLKLQTVGLSSGHDEAIARGDPTSRSFSVVYRRQGRVIALDCVNMVRDYVQGRKLVADGARVDAALLADPAVPLKSLG